LLPSVESVRGFAHAAGFPAAQRCITVSSFYFSVTQF